MLLLTLTMTIFTLFFLRLSSLANRGTLPLDVFTGYVICSGPAFFAFFTIGTTYMYTMKYKRFEDWIITPWISFTGVWEPQKSTFEYGLTLAAVMIFISNYWFTTKMMRNPNMLNTAGRMMAAPQFLRTFCSEYVLPYNLNISAVFLIILAWINTEQELCTGFLSPDISKISWFFPWNNGTHIITAIIFKASGSIHCLAVVLTLNRKTQGLEWSYYWKVLMLSLQIFAFSLMVSTIWLAAFVLDPVTQEGLFHFALNCIGLGQYILVFALCLFVLSYGWDYRCLVANGKKID